MPRPYYKSLKTFREETFEGDIIITHIKIDPKHWNRKIIVTIMLEGKELICFSPGIRSITAGNAVVIPICNIPCIWNDNYCIRIKQCDIHKVQINVSNIRPEKVMIRAKVL